jgi:hypothetical protein
MEERATTDRNNPACKFFGDSSCRTSCGPWTELLSMGGQANSVCQPCYVQPETTLHLVAQCPYSKAIWTELAEWSELQCLPTPRRNFNRLKTWWQAMAAQGAHSLQDNQSKLQKLLYTVWHNWKERCHRVYDRKAIPVSSLCPAIKNDVHLWHIAWHTTGVTFSRV